MEVLQKQEELLKGKLEDAATIVERRQLRAELREIRNKLANFSVNEDENANIVETKNDINANTIIAKKDVKISVPADKIIDNASKQCSDSNEKKKEPEYRVTDETEQLRIKTADERASRRARRQDRMAKLAKEQTDDCNKTENSTEINERDRKGDKKDDENSVRSMSSFNGPVSEVSSRRRETKDETAKDNVESRSKGYLSDRKAEIAKVAEDANKNTRPLSQKLNINIGKKEDSNNNNVGKSTLNSYGNTARIFTQKKEEERKQEDEEDKNAIKNSCSSSSSSSGGVNKHSSWKRSEDESNIVPKPEVKYMKSKENASTAFVNAPASLTTRTERKEERTVAVGVGGKMEGVKHQVETKSFMQNSQQFSNTKTTTSRVSSALDRFNGGGNDKSKALSTIGKALGPGSARNRFLNAEKGSVNKPIEFGLNFTKKSDKPGYTVKKFTEAKTEEKNTSFGKVELGLSFLNKKKEMDVKTNLRETESGSAYKKASPSLQRRHQTAPAFTGQALSFKLPGGGSKTSSVANRMQMFKESQEEEKARMEKQKQRETQQRERLASDPTPVKSPTSSTAPCVKKREVKKPIKRTMSISNIVLDWCKEMVKDYGIEIRNFSGSWSSGLAFCALIHRFNPDKFDFKELNGDDRERNFRTAFDTAFEVKNIPKLLDVEDMVKMAKPEPRSVQCYVQWIWSVYGPTSGYGPSMEEIRKAQVS